MTLPDDVVERVARAISATVDVDLHGGDVADYCADDWRDFEPEARAALEAARYGEIAEAVRLFPEAHDTLTNQEMRDAKGNLRSLIDQQTNALTKLRALLSTIGEPTDIGG